MGMGGLLLSALLGGLFGGIGGLVGWTATRKLPAGRRQARFQLIAGLASIPGIVAGQVIAQSDLGSDLQARLGMRSRVEVALEREAKPLLDDPRFKEMLKGKSADEAQAHASALSARGIPLLPGPRLDTWARLRLRLAEGSPQLCAALWKGGASPATVVAALERLSDAELQRWAALSADAMRASLAGAPAAATAPEVLQQSMAGIAGGLPPEQQARFLEDAGRQDLSDARACELFKTLMAGAERLVPESRTEFHRALAAQM